MGGPGHLLLRASPLVLATGYAILVITLSHQGIGGFVELFKVYAWTMYPVWALVGLILLLIGRLRNDLKGIPHSSFDHACAFLRQRWADDHWLSIICPPLTVTLLLCAYNIYKQIDLPVAGFGAETYLAEIDRLVLGADAWQVTHWLLPSPWVSAGLDLAYHAWFLPMTLGVVFCSFARPGSPLALRYLMSYALLWIIQGTIIAYLLPASGPCFYPYFHAGPSSFGDLNRLLAAQHAYLSHHGTGGLDAVVFQPQLLRDFASPNLALGAGISAMPSMHNAMAVLFACAARHVDRRAGWAFIAYAGVIWLASVHLGWHYGIDGLIAALLTIAIWKIVGAAYAGTPLAQPIVSRRAIGAAEPA